MPEKAWGFDSPLVHGDSDSPEALGDSRLSVWWDELHQTQIRPGRLETFYRVFLLYTERMKTFLLVSVGFVAGLGVMWLKFKVFWLLIRWLMMKNPP